jgi:hypothetical protein
MTATVLPVFTSGTCGVTQPCVPRLVDDRDLDLLDRDRVLVDAEHAGRLARRRAQRPVNSGKLLVACSRSIASRQSSR